MTSLLSPSRLRHRGRGRRPARFAAALAVVVLVFGAAACGSSSSEGGGGSSCYVSRRVTPKANAPTHYPATKAFGSVRVTGRVLRQPSSSGGHDPAAGCKAPLVEGQTFSGKPIRLAADGRPTVIFFLAHWCPHCNREVPTLVADWKAHGRPSGVKMLSVATGSDLNAPNFPPSTWLKRLHWPLPAMADSQQDAAGLAMGLPGYPYYVFLKPDDTVFFRTSGEWPISAFNQKIAALKAASKEKAHR